MGEEGKKPAHGATAGANAESDITRTNTEVESRGGHTPTSSGPPEDTPRTGTEIESRSAEQKDASRPSEQPDTPRG